MSTRTERRRKAERHGRWAESLCLWSLRLKGYRILARNFSCHLGELDLIALDGDGIVFVEVRSTGGGRGNDTTGYAT